jgi:predicted dehydrogenase/NADPH:quinone reductase-like Zn-dependent oxidoreductase
MLQVLIKKGRAAPSEVPAPVVTPGCVLVKVVNSCISSGTELSGVKASGKSIIRQALEQPQKVAKALNMMRGEGIAKTIAKIKGRFEAGSPTGYSASGVVIGVGDGVSDLRFGDRVAAAGAGYANHAEFIDVPRNLVMRIPDGLGFVPAATVTLGGIAVQGVRRAAPQLGEYAAAYGAGILGTLAVRILWLSGARVIAVDIDDRRLDLARLMGAELILNPTRDQVVDAVRNHTDGRLVDVTLFSAATSDSKVLSQAFALTRRKGRLVMVGVWGKELDRNDIYAKEIDFLISTSYGPGRYDADYEEGGHDYPYDYVRWTENRNMAEYLRLLATGRLDVGPLIQGVYPIARAEEAYAALQAPERPMMALLDYGQELPEGLAAFSRTVSVGVRGAVARAHTGRIRAAIVGAGNYAQGMHLPNIKNLSDLFTLRAVCSRTGANAKAVAVQYSADYATTDFDEVLADEHVDLVILCTRHNLHGPQALSALKSGKHVLVEKPLCLTQEELDAIAAFYEGEDHGDRGTPLLAVGFNRRFSKYADEVRRCIQGRSTPLFLRYRMNAGYLPPDHWTHGHEGGGRIVGEACHIVDLLRSVTGSPVQNVSAASLHPTGRNFSAADNKIITLEYTDGSVGSIEYLSVGAKDLPKEYFETHFDGKSVIVDDYRSVGGHGVDTLRLADFVPDKGQLPMLKQIGLYIAGKRETWPIALEELIETTAITFAVR